MTGDLLDPAALERFVLAARARGCRIVFTNGVSTSCIRVAFVTCGPRAHGDVLIVGLNSDASVRNKARPAHQPEEGAPIQRLTRGRRVDLDEA